MPLSYAFKVVKKFYVTHFTAIKTVKKVYLPVVQLDQFSSALDPMPGFRFRQGRKCWLLLASDFWNVLLSLLLY